MIISLVIYGLLFKDMHIVAKNPIKLINFYPINNRINCSMHEFILCLIIYLWIPITSSRLLLLWLTGKSYKYPYSQGFFILPIE